MLFPYRTPKELRAWRANQPKITTLVVRNLHILTCQQEFLDEVNGSGFAETYDFAYLPRNFEDGSGKGHAFINLKGFPPCRRLIHPTPHHCRRPPLLRRRHRPSFA